MGTSMNVIYPDRVVTIALYHYSFEWDQGRLLAGGPVFGSQHMSRFHLDLRYWKITPSGAGTLNCNRREEKHVILVTKEGDQVISQEAIGYEKFVKDKQDAYGVFLKNGNTELLSSADYEFYFQTIQDYTRGRNVIAMIATKKETK